MVAIGVSYLIFEKKVLLKSKLAGDSAALADNSLSRSLIGIQVRFCKIGIYDFTDRNRSASLSWR
jgi:hypothetical protein